MTRGQPSKRTLTRRTVLATGATAVAAGTTAGTASAQVDEGEFNEWMSDVPNYEEVEDHTGEETVEVTVGAGDDGLLFEPAAVRVDPETTVNWVWTGEGGQHNVAAEDESFESELTEEEGHEFDHEFEEEGIFTYGCEPHIANGMKGAVVVGDVELGGGGSTNIPLIPGLAAIVGIMTVVTAAIAKWTRTRRDTAQRR